MSAFKPQILNGVPIPYDAPVADLLAAIKEPGPMAWAAIRALAEKPEAEALAALVQLTSSSDPHRRRSAVEAIGIHPSGQTASEEVCQLLHDREGFVVRAATEAAANLGLASAHERVLDLVKTAEESVRLAALSALENLWQSSDFEPVFDRYLHDPADPVRKQAAWTLHKNVGAEHWERVFAVWSKDPLPRHRMWACQYAGSFGTSMAVPALEALRADPDGHVRLAAQQALEQIHAGEPGGRNS